MRAVIDTNVLLSGQVDLIVSGDDDLLALIHFQNIPIVTPTQAIQRIEAG